MITTEQACAKMHDAAIKELGIHESGTATSTARIIEYDQHTALKATSDHVAWCSSFINFISDECSFPGTNSAAAINWLTWGKKLKEPILGCIVVLKRDDSQNHNAAHVTLCDHPNIANGMIRCLGGNQSGGVKVSRYPTKNVLGYRSPI